MNNPADAPLHIAVIGHTNTGKTSLMRTLLRDAGFGEIANQAGTTRYVESASLCVDGQAVLELADTPGLEDSLGLIDALQEQGTDPNRISPEALGHFLGTDLATSQFEQEAKVIREILQAHALFYVIDVREPLLGKYKEELTLIQGSARPVIPVLNFTAQPTALTAQWQDYLARSHMHAYIAFDNVVFRFEDEKRLLTTVQSLLPEHFSALQALISEREQDWKRTTEGAARCIASAFIHTASLRLESETDQPSLKAAGEHLQDQVRRLEDRCLKELLRLFQFQNSDVRLENLPVQGGRWSRDLFDPNQLRQFGLEAGGDAAKGAALGAGVDLALGGLSLGAASALGALGGMLWRTSQRYGKDWVARWQGKAILCVDSATLEHLWQRQLTLMRELSHRGHASQDQVSLAEGNDISPAAEASWIKQARANPEWVDDNYENVAKSQLLKAITKRIITLV